MSLAAFTFANVAASQTDTVLVSGATKRMILVIGLTAECGATATDITFNSKGAGAGTAITMTFQNGINGGFVLPYSEVGWFKTNSGEALTCTTGAGSTTGVQVVYQIILVPSNP